LAEPDSDKAIQVRDDFGRHIPPEAMGFLGNANYLMFRRRFSLRALLLFIAAWAVVFGLVRYFGTSALPDLVFALVSAFALAMLPSPWKRAFSISWAAVYGPFIVVTSYTLFGVSCAHCQATIWRFLPCWPALFPVAVAWRVLDLRLTSESILFTLSFLA